MKKTSYITGILVALMLGLLPVFLSPQGSLAAANEAQKEINTMEASVHFTGTTKPGTKFSVSVYTFRSGEEKRVFYRGELVVGNSGMYDFLLPLPVLGEQFIAIETEEETTITCYRRYDRSLPASLSGYYLNVYDFLNKR